MADEKGRRLGGSPKRNREKAVTSDILKEIQDKQAISMRRNLADGSRGAKPGDPDTYRFKGRPVQQSGVSPGGSTPGGMKLGDATSAGRGGPVSRRDIPGRSQTYNRQKEKNQAQRDAPSSKAAPKNKNSKKK